MIAGRNAPPMSFSGSGYEPGDTVLVTSSDGTVDATVKADARGRIAGRSRAPTPDIAAPAVKRIRLTASDQTVLGVTISAATTVNVTQVAWAHGSTRPRPGLGALTGQTDWSFSGFRPGALVFGHYLRDGRQVALARFGRARPPCGTLRVRARLYPTRPHHTSYTVQYDDQRPYSTHAQPSVVGALTLSH